MEKEIFRESINVFRVIRQYTEGLGKGNMKVDDLYEAMGDIIQNRLHIDVAIYKRVMNATTRQFKQVYSSPNHLYLPKEIRFNVLDEIFPEDSETFQGCWWLIPFGNEKSLEGYIGLRVELSSQNLLPPGSFIVDNQCREEVKEKAENSSAWDTSLMGKDYFIDLVVNIIEHFESALLQIIILQRNAELIKKLKEQNDLLMMAREENKTAVRQGREWVSVMSHEIRNTPVCNQFPG